VFPLLVFGCGPNSGKQVFLWEMQRKFRIMQGSDWWFSASLDRYCLKHANNDNSLSFEHQRTLCCLRERRKLSQNNQCNVWKFPFFHAVSSADNLKHISLDV
jgi:hypothetical protein